MSQPKACPDVIRPPVSEILIFSVDDHRYGLSTACVQELVRAVRLVPVPHPAEGIEGVIDLHGQIVPVIDLRRSLGREAKAPQPTEHLIIVHTEARLVAIRADRATDVRQIEPEMLQVMPDAFDGAGIIRMPDGIVMMLDALGLDPKGPAPKGLNPMAMAARSEDEGLQAAIAASDGE
jgi:purine-binding chemotaxis protein CheW